MLVRINFGCGITPTDGWINLDNSYDLRLKNFYQEDKIYLLTTKLKQK